MNCDCTRGYVCGLLKMFYINLQTLSIFIETMPDNWRQRTSWLSLVHPQSHEEQQAVKAQKRGSKFHHRPLLLSKSLLIHKVHVRPPKVVHFVSPMYVFVVTSDWYRCWHKLSLIDVNSYCNVYGLNEDIWACWWDDSWVNSEVIWVSFLRKNELTTSRWRKKNKCTNSISLVSLFIKLRGAPDDF